MPTYIFVCENDKCEHAANEIEINAPINKRDEQKCLYCQNRLTRLIRFTGSVWSPTKNGGSI